MCRSTMLFSPKPPQLTRTLGRPEKGVALLFAISDRAAFDVEPDGVGGQRG